MIEIGQNLKELILIIALLCFGAFCLWIISK